MYYYISSQTIPSRYLSHHGILGQKWGVRRYQNRDGTRTALGKRRSDSEGKFHTREKRVGEGSSAATKGLRVGTSGPVGGTKIDRPSFVSSRTKVEGYVGNADKGAKKVSVNINGERVKTRTYSKLEDWWGTDERDRLKTAIDFLNSGSTTQAAFALYTQDLDNQMTASYNQLQGAIDAYEEDPSEKNKKKYEEQLAKYQAQVGKYNSDNMVAAYVQGIIDERDVKAYIDRCGEELTKTPSFKVQATIEKGKRYISSKATMAKNATMSLVRRVFK